MAPSLGEGEPVGVHELVREFLGAMRSQAAAPPKGCFHVNG